MRGALECWNGAKDQSGAEGAQRLASALLVNTQLRELACSDVGMGDEGASALGAALRANSALRVLRLERNGVTDAGVQSLVDAIGKHGLSFLANLSLDRNAVSDVGLGAIAAVQIFEAAERELGAETLAQKLSAGDFKPLREWLREKIHARGSVDTSLDELLSAVCGEPLSPKPFLAYLTTKYTALYGL